MARGASDRGEGVALTYADYARAVLYNGHGNYGPAAEAAHGASAVDEIVISPWALYELVEAAARSDQQERACGAAARSRALVSAGRAAEQEYREAIDLLGEPGWRPTWPAPAWSTANGCAGRTGGSMPATSFGPRSTRSRPWAPEPSPNARGESSRRPARRCASAAKTPAAA
jgi:hypothetical protein